MLTKLLANAFVKFKQTTENEKLREISLDEAIAAIASVAEQLGKNETHRVNCNEPPDRTVAEKFKNRETSQKPPNQKAVKDVNRGNEPRSTSELGVSSSNSLPAISEIGSNIGLTDCNPISNSQKNTEKTMLVALWLIQDVLHQLSILQAKKEPILTRTEKSLQGRENQQKRDRLLSDLILKDGNPKQKISANKPAVKTLPSIQTNAPLDWGSDSESAIFYIDANARLVEVSETACSLLGYSREESRAMTGHEIDVKPEEARAEGDWLRHWQKLEESALLTLESYYRTKSGNLLPVQITFHYVEKHSREYCCAIAREIPYPIQTEPPTKALYPLEQPLNESHPTAIANSNELTAPLYPTRDFSVPQQCAKIDSVRQAFEQHQGEKGVQEKSMTPSTQEVSADLALLIDTEGVIRAVSKTTSEIVLDRLHRGEPTSAIVGSSIYDPSEIGLLDREPFDRAIRTGAPVEFQETRGNTSYQYSVYPLFDDRFQVTAVTLVARYPRIVAQDPTPQTISPTPAAKISRVAQQNQPLKQKLQHQTNRLKKINEQLQKEIQHRKQLEQTLRSHLHDIVVLESQQKILIENSPGAIYSCTTSGNYARTFISENISTLLGYEAQEVIANPGFWLERLHPEDAPRMLAELKKFENKDRASNGSTQTYQYRFKHKDGSYRRMQDHIEPILNANGLPEAIVGYWLDITQKNELADLQLKQESEILQPGVSQATYREDEAYKGKKTDSRLDTHRQREWPIASTGEIGQRYQARKEREQIAWIVNQSADPIAIVTFEGQVSYINPAGRSQLGLETTAEIKSRSLIDFVTYEDRSIIHKDMMPAMRLNGYWKGELRFQNVKTGQQIPMHCDVFTIPNPISSEIQCWAIVSRHLNDPNSRLDLEGQLDSKSVCKTNSALIAQHENNDRYYRLANLSPVGIFRIDALGKSLLYVNEHWCQMSGRTLSEAVGSNWVEASHPEDRERIVTQWSESVKQNLPFKSEYRLLKTDGAIAWVVAQIVPETESEGEIIGYLGTITDISDRVQAEEKLRQAAFHDTLTGLPNRAFFKDCLYRTFERIKQESEHLCAVLFVDLDRFKAINDNLGHEVGDCLLIAIARRLLAAVRSGDTVARLSGDEFAILLDPIQDIHDATSVAVRILEALRSAFKLLGHEVFINASIGIALSRDESSGLVYEGAADLLRNADAAMYRAKTQGRNRYEVFDRTMHDRALALLQIENDLRRALPKSPKNKGEPLSENVLDALEYLSPENRVNLDEDPQSSSYPHKTAVSKPTRILTEGSSRLNLHGEDPLLPEFAIHYQPIVSLETGRLSGFEALVRWQHPQRGLVSPAEFIPVAEDIGLMRQIGQWVLREACHQLHLWQVSFPIEAPLTMSINLSGKQLAQPDLIEQIDRILEDSGIDAGTLTLEITESVLIQHVEAATELLAALKCRNIGLCIDDFGTGYSSLSYLHRFPIDALKIDRSFISQIGVEEETTELIRSITILTHNLGMSAIAEGVESEKQLVQLWALKCKYGQGYFFSEPLDKVAAEKLLAAVPQW